jgi:hypothetical protein
LFTVKAMEAVKILEMQPRVAGWMRQHKDRNRLRRADLNVSGASGSTVATLQRRPRQRRLNVHAEYPPARQQF